MITLEPGHATAPNIFIIFNYAPSNWSGKALMKKRNYWLVRCGRSCAVATISFDQVEQDESIGTIKPSARDLMSIAPARPGYVIAFVYILHARLCYTAIMLPSRPTI